MIRWPVVMLLLVTACSTARFYRREAAPIPLVSKTDATMAEEHRACAQAAARHQNQLPADLSLLTGPLAGAMIGAATGAAVGAAVGQGLAGWGAQVGSVVGGVDGLLIAQPTGYSLGQRRQYGLAYYRACMTALHYAVR